MAFSTKDNLVSGFGVPDNLLGSAYGEKITDQQNSTLAELQKLIAEISQVLRQEVENQKTPLLERLEEKRQLLSSIEKAIAAEEKIIQEHTEITAELAQLEISLQALQVEDDALGVNKALVNFFAKLSPRLQAFFPPETREKLARALLIKENKAASWSRQGDLLEQDEALFVDSARDELRRQQTNRERVVEEISQIESKLAAPIVAEEVLPAETKEKFLQLLQEKLVEFSTSIRNDVRVQLTERCLKAMEGTLSPEQALVLKDSIESASWLIGQVLSNKLAVEVQKGVQSQLGMSVPLVIPTEIFSSLSKAAALNGETRFSIEDVMRRSRLTGTLLSAFIQTGTISLESFSGVMAAEYSELLYTATKVDSDFVSGKANHKLNTAHQCMVATHYWEAESGRDAVFTFFSKLKIDEKNSSRYFELWKVVSSEQSQELKKQWMEQDDGIRKLELLTKLDQMLVQNGADSSIRMTILAKVRQALFTENSGQKTENILRFEDDKLVVGEDVIKLFVNEEQFSQINTFLFPTEVKDKSIEVVYEQVLFVDFARQLAQLSINIKEVLKVVIDHPNLLVRDGDQIKLLNEARRYFTDVQLLAALNENNVFETAGESQEAKTLSWVDKQLINLFLKSGVKDVPTGPEFSQLVVKPLLEKQVQSGPIEVSVGFITSLANFAKEKTTRRNLWREIAGATTAFQFSTEITEIGISPSDPLFIEAVSFGILQMAENLTEPMLQGITNAGCELSLVDGRLHLRMGNEVLNILAANEHVWRQVRNAIQRGAIEVEDEKLTAALDWEKKVKAALLESGIKPVREVYGIIQSLSKGEAYLNYQSNQFQSKLPIRVLAAVDDQYFYQVFTALSAHDLIDSSALPQDFYVLQKILPEALRANLLSSLLRKNGGVNAGLGDFWEIRQSLRLVDKTVVVDLGQLPSYLLTSLWDCKSALLAAGYILDFENTVKPDEGNKTGPILRFIDRLKERGFLVVDGESSFDNPDTFAILESSFSGDLQLTDDGDVFTLSGGESAFWQIWFLGKAFHPLLLDAERCQAAGIVVKIPKPQSLEDADFNTAVMDGNFPRYSVKSRNLAVPDMDFSTEKPVWKYAQFYRERAEGYLEAVKTGDTPRSIPYDRALNSPFPLETGFSRPLFLLLQKLQTAAEVNQSQPCKEIYLSLLADTESANLLSQHLVATETENGLKVVVQRSIFPEFFDRKQGSTDAHKSRLLVRCLELATKPINAPGLELSVEPPESGSELFGNIAKLNKIITILSDQEEKGHSFIVSFIREIMTGDNWEKNLADIVQLFDYTNNSVTCRPEFFDVLFTKINTVSSGGHYLADFLVSIKNRHMAEGLNPEVRDYLDFLALLGDQSAIETINVLIKNWQPGEGNPALIKFQSLVVREGGDTETRLSSWRIRTDGFWQLAADKSALNVLEQLAAQGKLRINELEIIDQMCWRGGQKPPVTIDNGLLTIFEEVSGCSIETIVKRMVENNSELKPQTAEILEALSQQPFFQNTESRLNLYGLLIKESRHDSSEKISAALIVGVLSQKPELAGNTNLHTALTRLDKIYRKGGDLPKVLKIADDFSIECDETYESISAVNFTIRQILNVEWLGDADKTEEYNKLQQVFAALKFTRAYAREVLITATLEKKISYEVAILLAQDENLVANTEILLRNPEIFLDSTEKIQKLHQASLLFGNRKRDFSGLIMAVSIHGLEIERLIEISDRVSALPHEIVEQITTFASPHNEDALQYLGTEEGLSFVERLVAQTTDQPQLGVKILELTTGGYLSQENFDDPSQRKAANRQRAEELISPSRKDRIAELLQTEVFKYPRAFLSTDEGYTEDYPQLKEAYSVQPQKTQFLDKACQLLDLGLVTFDQAKVLPESWPTLFSGTHQAAFALAASMSRFVPDQLSDLDQLDTLVSLDQLQQSPTQDRLLGNAYGETLRQKKISKSSLDTVLVEYLEDAATSKETISVIQDDNWEKLLLLFMMIEEDDDAARLTGDKVEQIKLLFEKKETKDFCLRKVRSSWLAYLDNGDPDSLPYSLIVAAKAMNRFGGAGPLKHIGANLELAGKFSNAIGRIETATSSKTQILVGLKTLEQRFDRDGWSDDDRSYFYAISADMLQASPSLYADFVKGLTVSSENLSERFTPKELKAFAKDIYPLYQARLAVTGTTVGEETTYPPRELVNIRRDIRQFFENTKSQSTEERQETFATQRSEQLEIIKEFFAQKYGILKVPEDLGPESVRTIQNISKYVANIAKKDGNSPDNSLSINETRELTLALFLALQINGVWEQFRAGEPIDLNQYFAPDRVKNLQPILEKRAKLQVINPSLTGLTTEQISTLQRTIQSETESVHTSNIMTVDEKLGAVAQGLRDLADQDAFLKVEEKQFLALYQKHGTKTVNSVLAGAYRILGGATVQMPDEQIAALADLKSFLTLNNLEFSQPVIKRLQESMQHVGVVVSMTDFLETERVDDKLADLRQILNPSAEVIAIFNRFGEGFQPESGAFALSQDLDYLQNLIIKHEHELTTPEIEIINNYIKEIADRIEKLEQLLEKIKQKFSKLKTSSSIVKGTPLEAKVADLNKVIEMQGLAQEVTTKMTGDLNLVIENMRACLGPSRKEVNNDTTLRVGDSNFFFVVSQAESKRGSFADQIVLLEPVSLDGTNWQPAFVMDKVYGTRTPDVLANHIRVIIKKLRAIKGTVGGAPVSILITQAALWSCSADTNVDLVMEKLRSSDDLNGVEIKPVENAQVEIKESALADPYVEFASSSPRAVGQSSVNGLLLNLL